MNHFCGSVGAMGPFINRMKCVVYPQKMHTHARFCTYFRGKNLAVMSRDETDRELSPFSLTKCVATSSEKGEQLFKSISSTSTASSLLALEGPPRSGCRLLWKPGRAASGEPCLPDARCKRREPGGQSAGCRRLPVRVTNPNSLGCVLCLPPAPFLGILKYTTFPGH